MLIGFSGKMGSGKSTAAKMIKGAHIIPFAGALKESIQRLFMFTEDQMYTELGKNTVDPRWGVTPREVMQKFGTDFVRNHFPNFWVDRMKIVLDYYSYRDIICIDDIRFFDEAELVRRMGGTVVHVVGRAAEAEADLAGHSSEQGIEFMAGDTYLDNSGSLETLKRSIDNLLSYETGVCK